MILLSVIMSVLGKLINKFEGMLIKLRTFFLTMIFTQCSIILTLCYSMVAISMCNVVNPLLCSVFFVFAWFLEEKMYQFMAGEKGCVSEKTKVLEKGDKNVCKLFSLVGVIIIGLVLCFEEENLEYAVLISIAISLWIGTYVPLGEIYEGITVKKMACGVVKEFNCKNKLVWISSILASLIVIVFTSKNKVVLKLRELLDKFAIGMAVGTMILILLLVFEDYIKKIANKKPNG